MCQQTPPKLASLIKEVLTMYAIIATGGKQYTVAEGKLLFTSTRERLAITRRMVTDSHILRLRSRRSTLNWY